MEKRRQRYPEFEKVIKTRDVTRFMNLDREKGHKLRALHEATTEDWNKVIRFLEMVEPGPGVDPEVQKTKSWELYNHAIHLQLESKKRAYHRRLRLEALTAIPAEETGLWGTMPEVRVPAESV